VVCPYPGSRHKHEKPMNLSGLRQLRSHWGDVIAGLKYLRGLYPQPAPHIRYIDLWRICNLGKLLPTFLLYRRSEPIPNGQLPSDVAGVYKVAIGLIHAAQQLAFTGLFQGIEKIDEQLDHDQLYAFVEENNLFIGAREVCAGPEALVREVVNVLKDTPAALDPAQKIQRLIGNEEIFLEFADCWMNSLVLSYLYSLITESLYSRVCKVLWPGSRSEELFSPEESQLALLADVDPTVARGILSGIIDFALSDPQGGGRLNEAAAQMSDLFNGGTPSPEVAGLLERQRMTGMADDIARYLQLEKISFGLSRTLKQQCLKALGLEDSLHLNAMARDFFPPDSKMRSLLHVMLGIEVLPNLQVQSRGKVVMSLTEDSPWSW